MRNEEARPYRVLVVDDLSHERQAIIAAIEQAVPTCEFIEADSVPSAEAIIKEQAEPFDLAVIDLRLEDDVEGLKLFGPKNPIHPMLLQTRIIVLTAYPSWQTACKAYESGASTYLSKLDPDSTEKLQQKARQLLLLENMRRQLDAQYRADQAFAHHYEGWCKQYAGKCLLVRGEEVLSVHDTLYALSRGLQEYPDEDRPDIGIVKVPPLEQEGANS